MKAKNNNHGNYDNGNKHEEKIEENGDNLSRKEKLRL